MCWAPGPCLQIVCRPALSSALCPPPRLRQSWALLRWEPYHPGPDTCGLRAPLGTPGSKLVPQAPPQPCCPCPWLFGFSSFI